jgi:hypothetical protein
MEYMTTEDKYNGIESIMWVTENNNERLHGYKLATGEGLFKHIRLDNCIKHCDKANSYNMQKIGGSGEKPFASVQYENRVLSDIDN